MKKDTGNRGSASGIRGAGLTARAAQGPESKASEG